ncbi:MAG TPA: M20/M25/M40 family metallo-hydrolase [Candidatus Poseidoniales archaeon]|jgi:hypothetical protein|nr:MAG: hypothetical protein CXT71_00770 [Euryarchaeota archaeon]HIF46651.1 M20/M25/M40 family metallo-hydrolase [Candidatus Poseidoniales archaeon]HIL65112.1 M20/M25/M40 family metallo-hydrolase [Candidatus Poseidoniales archaeon]
MVVDEVLEAEMVYPNSKFKSQAIIVRDVIMKPAILASVLVVVFVSSTLVVIFVDFSPAIEYELIDFDETRARGFAQDLVDLGHEDWKGRMSGTAEELAAAQYVEAKLAELGYQTELNQYQVPMHRINSEPSLKICTPGLIVTGPGVCSTADLTASEYEFSHRIDYVIQGFSGESNFRFQNNAEIVHLGNGSDDALWESAAGKIGYIVSGGTVGSNTQIMVKAIENDLSSIIRVNKDRGCGTIEGEDCVPIFKGTGYDDMVSANGGSAPTQMAFIAMSKDAGEILELEVINGSGRLEMLIDVTNDEKLTINVPCGTMQGKSDEVVIIGGHHDTVYNGPGAIDDTSGSASVLEMAAQMATIFESKGQPDRTVKFCTWGGEEEGLWGSKAYVEQNKAYLGENLRLYVNLDMNHVDIDYETRGNSVTLFTNNEVDLQYITAITSQYEKENSEMANRYDIRLALYAGAKGEPDGMPYNSDHGPFVYDRGTKEDGRAVVCYGSGSSEYHTYLDDMSRFNEESLGLSITIYGTYVNYLAYSINA